MLHVPIPINYDRILTTQYGDWHQMVKNVSVHEVRDGGLFVDTEHPYTYYVDEYGIKKDVFALEVFKKTGKTIEI